MDKEKERWIYSPVTDEAAHRIAEIAASSCGTTICNNIARCHRDCMILIGEPWTDGVSLDSEKIPLQVTISCEDSKCSIMDNYAPDAIKPSEILIPTDLVKRAMTIGRRRQLMREARERYEDGADEDVEMETVHWY